MPPIHRHITVAGTFDRLHAGHRYLLDLAFERGEKVSIGLTREELYKDKILSERVESYAVRERILITYLQEQGYSRRADIFPLADIHGIAAHDGSLDAIVVTEDTVANAEKINEDRLKHGLDPMEIIVAPFLEGDDNEPISSSRIRLGVIDRDGHSYHRPFKEAYEFEPPLLLKDELRSPIGDLISGPEDNYAIAVEEVMHRLKKDNPTLVIAVGDIITSSLQKAGFDPHISFIDNRTRRRDVSVHHTAHETYGPYQNPAGRISSKIALAYAWIVKDTLEDKKHRQIVIDGEEDLLGLPAILLAPLGSVVLYGQFDAGIVYVPVTEEMKRYCDTMLRRCLTPVR
jgi:phosphopantetheine adenylyltransferase/uncharacterized protein (UPF0218 family)